jgi:acetyltransferase-like isoleucine patch superfamily enzyme
MIALRALHRSLFIRAFRLMNKRRFKSFGRDVYVFPGIDISGERSMEIGDGVIILDSTVLAVHQQAHADGEQLLRIGAGSNIGRRNHIYAFAQIDIGRKVLTASNVYISDCGHAFSDISRAIIDQPIDALPPVRIGDGAWIGQNACVIGCSIGRNSVIGANSVVLHDIPENCVAVGSPARVVRQFDPKAGEWLSLRKLSDRELQ